MSAKFPRGGGGGGRTFFSSKSKPIQAFMVVLVTCKNDKEPFKNESTRMLTTFLPL